MFESSVTEVDPAVQRICAQSRAYNQAAAALYDGIGALYRQRLREDGDRSHLVIDTDDDVAAEVAVAMRISHGMALSHLRTARTMHERLPQLAALFLAGDIDYHLFDALDSRTLLITDTDILAAVDTELAATVPRWPSLSRSQLCRRADRIIARHDRDAVRRRKKAIEELHFDIWLTCDGTADVRGRLRMTDAHALDERLNHLAATVCAADGRSHTQRRADAFDALLACADRMICGCGQPDCPAGTTPPVSPVVIHVVANQSTLDGTDDTPAVLGADDLIPAEMLRDLARTAKIVPVVHPGDAPPEHRYTPSRALADFVRARDLTCRFPGCDRPARRCDIDHTIPYADGGPTHATNLKCLCRLHHLLKTFGGWTDHQLPDGTVIWISPARHICITTPDSALLFPTLTHPTHSTTRTAMMPTRRTTRAQNHHQRITQERRNTINEREANQQLANWERALRMAKDGPPPPF